MTFLSEKEFVILAILIANGESFGLDMAKKSDGQLKVGTIYPTLHRMEEKGLVTSREVPGSKTDTKMPRRVYKATLEGEKTHKLKYERLFNLLKLLEKLQK